MTAKERIRAADLNSLVVLRYPDPRLKEPCAPIECVDGDVAALAEKMRDLMLASNGVGLAAPQVGVPVRLFVASPTFQAADFHVYINPRIVEGEGALHEEEGCLSFPGIFCKVKRYATVTIEARDRTGRVFTQTLSGLHARIVQHENDHLDGILLSDRMGSVARLAKRRSLRQLEDQFAERS
jgi:peptide deformylase